MRARIRVRVWLACMGALLVMALGIYWALERQATPGQGTGAGGESSSAVASGEAASAVSPASATA